jgi:hypothetical protein
MAITEKYGEIDIPGVPRDEPVFILRGQDAAAAETILFYSVVAQRVGADPEHIRHILKSYEAVAKWPIKKIPDTAVKKVTP